MFFIQVWDFVGVGDVVRYVAGRWVVALAGEPGTFLCPAFEAAMLGGGWTSREGEAK